MPMFMLRQAGAALGTALLGSCRDLAPIVAVIAVFQVMILRQPFPEFFSIAMGLVLVVLGLALFVVGLDIGLFPLGETLAEEFARKGSLFWLLVFSFMLGAGTTVAEPALIAITREGAFAVSEAGLIPQPGIHCRIRAGCPFDSGCFGRRGHRHRCFTNPSRMALPYFILGGYGLVILMTLFAPKEIIGLAYDLGGVTTSTVTVPLVTALGVGLARTIRGRDPLTDGFGLIALASLTPMIFVMVYGLVMH
jgi:hypothetical protein